MGGVNIFILLFLIPSITIAAVTELKYTVGREYVYQIATKVQSGGWDLYSQTSPGNSEVSVTSNMITKCIYEDPISQYYIFAMNVFNTIFHIDANTSTINEALGNDTYYKQMKNGKITNVWYVANDDLELTSFKIGAINALQTVIVPANTQLTTLESGLFGNHMSNIVGSSSQQVGLVLSKTFTESDFMAFSDSALTKENVKFSGKKETGVHTEGYIQYSTETHFVALVNVTHASAQPLRSANADDNTGFDTVMGALGTLSLKFYAGKIDHRPLTSQWPPNALLYKIDTLYGFATRAAVLVKQNDIIVENPVDVFLRAMNEDGHKSVDLMTKLGHHLKSQPDDWNLLLPYLEDSLKGNAQVVDKVFFIISVAEADSILLKYGLTGANNGVMTRAVMAAGSFRTPTEPLVLQIQRIALLSTDDLVTHLARNIWGTLVGRIVDENLRLSHVQLLVSNLNKAIALYNEQEIMEWFTVLGNVGLSKVDISEIPLNFLLNCSDSLRNEVLSVFRKSGISFAQFEKIETEISAFPFNKSYTKAVPIGGKTIGLDLYSHLFAGTNFNCKHPNFNYKAEGELRATANLFGHHLTAFDARAVYGKEDGNPLENNMQLTVWGKVIYNKAFPSMDCQTHTYPLAHTSPGFAVRYTIWVVIVPITFSAGVSVNLDLSWQWAICDSQLSATVNLLPTASLTVTGQASVSLILVKAGVQLSGSFQEDLIPKGYIHGSLCALGIETDLVSHPMSIMWDGYYETKHCKHFIFDCHWGDPKKKVFWSWARPASTTVLFKQEWPIHI